MSSDLIPEHWRAYAHALPTEDLEFLSAACEAELGRRGEVSPPIRDEFEDQRKAMEEANA